MKLYEFGPTRSIRARWILQELGVEFDAVSVDLTRREHCSPDFLQLKRDLSFYEGYGKVNWTI